jgi:hypothetical protein
MKKKKKRLNYFERFFFSLLIISAEEEANGHNKKKVTIPDEFVQECQSFSFFFSLLFSYSTLLFHLVVLSVLLFIPLSASSNHKVVLVVIVVK